MSGGLFMMFFNHVLRTAWSSYCRPFCEIEKGLRVVWGLRIGCHFLKTGPWFEAFKILLTLEVNSPCVENYWPASGPSFPQVGVGKPYLYGLCAGGSEGVIKVVGVTQLNSFLFLSKDKCKKHSRAICYDQGGFFHLGFLWVENKFFPTFLIPQFNGFWEWGSHSIIFLWLYLSFLSWQALDILRIELDRAMGLLGVIIIGGNNDQID